MRWAATEARIFMHDWILAGRGNNIESDGQVGVAKALCRAAIKRVHRPGTNP
jgi:hypothetical protein